MFLLLLIGLALAGFAAAALMRGALVPRARTAETLQQIDSYGYVARASQAAVPRGGNVHRALDSIASRIGNAISARFGHATAEADLRIKLVSAGLYTMTPRRFMGYR